MYIVAQINKTRKASNAFFLQTEPFCPILPFFLTKKDKPSQKQLAFFIPFIAFSASL